MILHNGITGFFQLEIHLLRCSSGLIDSSSKKMMFLAANQYSLISAAIPYSKNGVEYGC